MAKKKEEIKKEEIKKEEIKKTATKMNLWQKIAELRASIAIKKNGKAMMKNKNTGNFEVRYTYYLIEQIYKESVKKFHELGLATFMNVDFVGGMYYGKLKIVNCDNPDEFGTFSMAVPPSAVQGASAAQSAGGNMTYLSKYCYMQLLMLDNSDDLDSRRHEDETEKPDSSKPVTDPKGKKGKKIKQEDGGAKVTFSNEWSAADVAKNLRELSESGGIEASRVRDILLSDYGCMRVSMLQEEDYEEFWNKVIKEAE